MSAALTLEELADRVEAASGPDAGIDAIIYEQVLGECIHAPMLKDVSAGDELELVHVCKKCGKRGSMGYRVFRPTASLDAAMSLVPDLGDKSWFFVQRLRDGRYQAAAALNEEGDVIAATPALALCAAALRARSNA